jgi:hypothetical protein
MAIKAFIDGAFPRVVRSAVLACASLLPLACRPNVMHARNQPSER